MQHVQEIPYELGYLLDKNVHLYYNLHSFKKSDTYIHHIQCMYNTSIF